MVGSGSSLRRTSLRLEFPASRELTGAIRRIWAQTAALTAESIAISEAWAKKPSLRLRGIGSPGAGTARGGAGNDAVGQRALSLRLKGGCRTGWKFVQFSTGWSRCRKPWPGGQRPWLDARAAIDDVAHVLAGCTRLPACGPLLDRSAAMLGTPLPGGPLSHAHTAAAGELARISHRVPEADLRGDGGGRDGRLFCSSWFLSTPQASGKPRHRQ